MYMPLCWTVITETWKYIHTYVHLQYFINHGIQKQQSLWSGSVIFATRCKIIIGYSSQGGPDLQTWSSSGHIKVN